MKGTVKWFNAKKGFGSSQMKMEMSIRTFLRFADGWIQGS